jgi:hypothetical protein
MDNHIFNLALEYLENNEIITYLNIARNEITNVGAQYIAQNNSLQQLNASNTKIGDEGAGYLAHSSVVHLYDLCTRMTIYGIHQFIGSPTLKTVKIDNPGTINHIELYHFNQEFEAAKLIIQAEYLE